MSDTEMDPTPIPGASGASTERVAIERIALRLPPFWPEEPAVWFAQVEAQFILSGITVDTTKFYQVIAQLDHKYAREVKDIITNPPQSDKYNKLKYELIKRLSISQEQRMRQLLTHEELGDRKPSQFLRHLRTLAENGVSDEFLRSLWSSRLPIHVQAIIASQSLTNLDAVAELADKICEVAPSPSQVASTSSAGQFDGLLQKLDELITSRIHTDLSQQISQLSKYQHGRERSPYRHGGNTRRRSKSRNQSQNRIPGLCWYHNRFGERATKCTQPCTFKAGNINDSQ